MRNWLVPAGGTLGLIVGNGPISVFAFGVFMVPLQSAFGWSRASLGLATALCALVSALSLPFVGLLMDKFGVRRLLAWGIGLFGLNVALIGQAHGLTGFILLTALTGLTGAAQSPMGYVKSIASYFDRRRGLAIGIAMSGIGLGTALIPQYVQWLIGAYGWRAGYLGLGAAIVVVALPAVGLLLREPRANPQVNPLVDYPPASTAQGPGLGLRQAIRLRAFWCIAGTVLLASIAVNGALVHVVPLLVDAGWTPGAAARVLAAAGVAGLVGRLLAGYLMDRMFAAYVTSTFFALAIVGLYLLGSRSNPVLGMVAIGLAAGAEVDMVGFFVSRYFGLKRFGELYGVFFSIFTVGAGLGPFLLGAASTRFHSYQIGFIGCGVALAMASVCILAVGPYAYVSPDDARAGAGASAA
ncbi:MFS transporter [Burkholderia guangdongensis]|uniref:MFS transporter n=1 Tax=Burkholderia guangdongensis TaxID=1792500 RepID=UPI0015CB1027|nr:MFS transporter [Burkholderia guangdongensis]